MENRQDARGYDCGINIGIEDSDLCICRMPDGCVVDGVVESESKANARLIAAAPDMLAALMEIQANPNDPRAHRMALDAIAKAKGERE